jgi:hypothetical protein
MTYELSTHSPILFLYDRHNVRGAGIAQSVQRLATDWTIRGPNPGGGEIFRVFQTGFGPAQPPIHCVEGLPRG